MAEKLEGYTPAEKALYLGRRNHAAKAEFPELLKGNRGSGRPKHSGMHEAFVQYEADNTGWCIRTIKSYLSLYGKLNEATLLRVRRTALDTKRDLTILSEMNTDQRFAYINQRLRGVSKRKRPRRTTINGHHRVGTTAT